MTPTPEQRAIIEAAKSPSSLMVNALAGTGKTTTLTMLAKALPAEPILALAFNKKIKEELEKRFPSNFTIMTMNGLGHKAWASTLNKQKLFIDDRKLSRLTTEALKPFRESRDAWAPIKMLVCHAMRRGLVPSQFQHAKGFLPDTPETWELLDVECDAGLSPDERRLARKILISSIEEGLGGKITFDDQVYLPVVFHGNFPRFNIVLVDEAQDLSPLNHAMLKKVCGGKLVVVGDPRQAIYAFRGADSRSMASIKALRKDWIELPLNTTFRCPKVVVERQQLHAPGYVAAEGNPQGKIVDWSATEWTWDNLKAIQHENLAILCRNNAPLVSMAFKLIKRGIGVNMLGREIGKGLEVLARKINPQPYLPISDFKTLLASWHETNFSLAQANDDQTKMENIQDKYECLMAVIEGKNPQTAHDLIQALHEIFASEGNVILASGHKSKGLEWGTVLHLDPWRIPSKFAKSPEDIEQENNLRYVLETRTKHTLILASVHTFKA
jgi:DNA helicase-2/ATP-dependent DNA helicase PcrA